MSREVRVAGIGVEEGWLGAEEVGGRAREGGNAREGGIRGKAL